MDTPSWDGVGNTESLTDSHKELRNRLADDASEYRWPAVLATLDEDPQLANTVRPGGRSGYTPLHQAAHGNAPIAVVRELVERGAWRTIRDARGRTALRRRRPAGSRCAAARTGAGLPMPGPHRCAPTTPVLPPCADPRAGRAAGRRERPAAS
ncbi:ankyrin repeat domain-containing protein [Virgisporangium ochraceum]|uniref:ankyrin repeat domain-containing protein n=1 Tax=Virgisporangium ochraceum TaxID=65505 RepID=UPI001945147D